MYPRPGGLEILEVEIANTKFRKYRLDSKKSEASQQDSQILPYPLEILIFVSLTTDVDFSLKKKKSFKDKSILIFAVFNIFFPKEYR